MIKRLIEKLKTLRLYFVIYSIFKRNKSDFYKKLMKDWGKDDVYGTWTKYKKDDGKLRFYKSYYMIDGDGTPKLLGQDSGSAWEHQLIGKNIHSVFTWCKDCHNEGVNIPFNDECGNCGSKNTVRYYDKETIDLLLYLVKNNGTQVLTHNFKNKF